MGDAFRIRIGFADPSPKDPDVVLVGGNLIEGNLRNGLVGGAIIDGIEVRMKVLEVAFLERAAPDAVMFSVQRPHEAPALAKWVGALFVGGAGMPPDSPPQAPRG